MTSLFELVSQSNELINKVVEEGGEITPELENHFLQVGSQLAHKVDDYATILDRIDSETAYWKAKKDQFAKVEKGLVSLKDRLKSAVLYAIQALNKEAIEGEVFKFKRTKSASRYDIDPKLVPGEYKNDVVTVVIDEKRLISDFKAGLDIPGITEIKSEHLRRYTATTLKGSKK